MPDGSPPQFPRGSVIRRVNAEPAIGFGAGRALLLQLAHPAVAQGVADHSDFQHNPFKRLVGTLEAVTSVVFGSRALAEGVGRRIHWIHEHVKGMGYTANDPDNLLWVHATLLDSALSCYERLVGPLTTDDREAYYQEMTVVAEIFGCPRDAQPETYAEFATYFDEQCHAIEVSDVGRALALDIVRPTLPLKLHVPLTPPLALHRLAAVGTTPAPLREQLGFTWSADEQRRLDLVESIARAVFRVTPRPVRTAPTMLQVQGFMRLAARHVRQFDDKMATRASASPAAA